MRDLRELNKLERYLRDNNYDYKRIDEEKIFDYFDRHQVIVYDHKTGKYLWDAICNIESYGCDEGLLEVMGTINENDYDKSEGWLTADEIIKRLEKRG